MPSIKNYSDLEEKRLYLERQLGADVFINIYKAIEVINFI